MQTSDILKEALRFEPTAAKNATHFVLCKGDKMRFFISLHSGKPHLVRSIVSYGSTLSKFIHLLPLIPFRCLKAARLGFFVKANLHEELEALIPPGCHWNMLIGTYGETQKLVIQYFNENATDCTYIKAGNAATEKEMTAEMRFLEKAHPHFKHTKIPELLSTRYRCEGGTFNIQVTKEFKGEKISPVLSEEIVDISLEIEGDAQMINGIPYHFSHGDFTPWNMRRADGSIIVFDWEHCGMKPHGYDLLYWAVVTRLACHGLSFEPAYEAAIEELAAFHVHPAMDKMQFYQLFTDVITPDGF